MPAGIITLLGPTAAGKTSLAVRLAARYNAEIISADSRQVYKGFDIGTGKDISEYTINGASIPYHLIDIITSETDYSVYDFRRDCLGAVNEISVRGKLPLVCGGTGLYLSSVLESYKMNQVEFDSPQADKLRKLEKPELVAMLKSINPSLHNTTDTEDKERIIKAIIVAGSGATEHAEASPVVSITLGVQFEREIIRRRISERLHARLRSGMIEEVRSLLDSGITPERMFYFGLEYKYITRYLMNEITYNDMSGKLETAIHQFAKRQMTWFRRMERHGVRIHWIPEGDFSTACGIVDRHINEIKGL